MMRRTRMTALAALAVTVAAGCGSERPVAVPTHRPASPPPPSAALPRPTSADCPKLSARGRSITHLDYVDFVQANGRNYIADLNRVPLITRAEVGARVMWVRCSFSKLNEATGQVPPKPRDGDAAFLAPGTALYAIRGWSPACRLAASHDGRLHVYLAHQPGGRVATPERCALANVG